MQRRDEWLKCDVCSQKIHTGCTSVPPEACTALVDYVAVLGYVCDDCRQSMRTSFHYLRAAVSVLTELASLRAELSNLKKVAEMWPADDTKQLCSKVKVERSETSNGTDEPKQLAPAVDIATVVRQIPKDNERRKCNIVVTGLPEKTEVDDCTQFLELCEHICRRNRT